jgi:hypothetical protein
MGILAYVVMAFVIPVADTEAEKKAAHGSASFTTQEFIRRARAGYYEGMKGFPDREAQRAWKRKFKRDMRDWSRSFQWQAQAGAWQSQWQTNWQNYWAKHPYQVIGWRIALPFLTFFNAALCAGFIILVFSLLATNNLAGQNLPSGFHVWMALVLLLIVYNLIIWPIKAARHVFSHGVYPANPATGGFLSLWDTFIWIVFALVLAWLAFTHLPEVTTAVQNIPVVFHDAKDNIEDWWSHH